MMAKPVLKSLKSRSYRFVVVLLLLCTLLTFNVGRVYRVEAVATTASVVGTVLLGLGVTYIAYQTLTGANVYVPDLTDDQSYLTELGRKFSMTASGNRLFQDLYNHLIADNTYSVIDFTSDRLQDIYNDHKSISNIQADSSFNFYVDTSMIPLNGFSYPTAPQVIPQIVDGYGSFDNIIASGNTITTLQGVRIYYLNSRSQATLLTTDINLQVRNILKSNGKYSGQYWNNGWFTFGAYQYHASDFVYDSQGNFWRYLFPNVDNMTKYQLRTTDPVLSITGEYTYPIFPDAVIYDEVNDVEYPLVPVDSNGNQITPQYPQNDNNDGSKYPLVPFVELPSTLKWGFNWRDALTDLVNGGSRLITSAWLADLINDFKSSLSGSGDDISYNYYNEGDTYYFTYYSDVVNDVYNPVYNINIEGQEDVIPVDLNTIQEYTDNVYLDTVKSSTLAFGSAIAEYFIFWHNADPVLFYTLCGSFIVILLGAFIGKWGHS